VAIKATDFELEKKNFFRFFLGRPVSRENSGGRESLPASVSYPKMLWNRYIWSKV
jgi:hypothetical protein